MADLPMSEVPTAPSPKPRAAASPRWVSRWHDQIDPRPVAPGVYRRKEGGFRIRGRAVDPRTGTMREVRRALPDARRANDAAAVLSAELDRIRAGIGDAAPSPRFAAYAATIFQRKVTDGRILSARGRDKWAGILRVHLVPTFGALYVDKITAADIEAWKAKIGPRIRSGEMSPNTGNTILSVLRVILGEAAAELDIRDPSANVRPFDTRGHRTYTDEAPNSLAPADVPRFLDKVRELYPQHFGFVFLGMVTGLRPSSLRPLRRKGPSPDLDLATGVLRVRRSHTRRSEVMDATKTARDQRISLPPAAVEVLRWHIAQLRGRAADSDLLFPTAAGGFRAGSCLDVPFDRVAAAIGLPYPVTPRAMRRTFNDLAREAGVRDVVTRAISGHATATMQQHYSTAREHEVSASLARVIDIATVRQAAPVAA